ncbi:hypothetical protein OH807_20610 [Kitasatospora sp. NBC_01560]|uniref:hypothetical protein n=1 Tax=Kitasatospora sp. NBC_01560 TaxID=2975965 RepID=UPI003863516B
MNRSALTAAGAAGVVVLLGGGLLGWHHHLDATEHRPPAVSLANGECRGALADPGFAGLLGATGRVRVDTQYRPADEKQGPVLLCVVYGAGHRVLTVAALGPGTDAPAPGGTVGTARFGCATAGRTEPYTVTVRLTGSNDTPGAARMTALADTFARAAAGPGALACAAGAGAPPTG